MSTQTDMQLQHSFLQKLVRSWKEFFMLLHPAELAQMGLLILNKVLGLYAAMVRVWWLQLIIMGALVATITYPALQTVMMTLYGLYILLLARSSVPAKNGRYLCASQKTGIACVLLLTIGALNVFAPQAPVWASLVLGWHRTLIVLSPLIRLIILCAYDAYAEVGAQVRALVRAMTLFLYHYPFFIMVYLIAWYLLYPVVAWPLQLLAWYLPVVQPLVHVVALMLWIPWYSAAIVYGYTRFMREHMDYYY